MVFKFRLQTVLDVKEKWLQQKQDEIQKLNMQLYEQNQKIDSLMKEMDQCEQDINSEENFTPEEISYKYEYYYDLAKQLEFEKLKKAEIEETLELKRFELIQQSKEVKILESLKEKQFLEFREEQQSQHQKLLDELAIIQNKNAV